MQEKKKLLPFQSWPWNRARLVLAVVPALFSLYIFKKLLFRLQQQQKKFTLTKFPSTLAHSIRRARWKDHWGKQTYSFHFRCYRPHSARHVQIKYRKKEEEADRKMKGIGERELEGRGRTSSYLELLSCNLLERRQERYKQKSQTDGFWLWGEGNIRYLLAKWQSVLIVHNTATTLPMECRLLNQRKERGGEKNPILSRPPPPPHSISSLHCMSTCFAPF